MFQLPVFGPIIVSRLGHDQQQQVTISGDAVNLASRLIDIAKDQSAIIAVSTDLTHHIPAALYAEPDVRARVAMRGRMAEVDVALSLVGFNGAPLSATYAATKGFVQSFAEGIASEMRPLGVDVLSVAPGPVGTGFAARAGMQMGQSATPETVARSALAALGRRTTVRPGFLAEFLGYSLAMLPRSGRVQVMGLIMKGMIGKDKARNVRQDAKATATRG